MSNRGIGRAKLFMGSLLLLAAAISWFTAFMMSPHGGAVSATSHAVRTTVAIFLRNNAVGNLILCALAAWQLFPARRPRWPARDYAILAVLGVIVLTSLYQLIWLGSVAS